MNMKWSLKELYESFADNKYLNDLDKCDMLINKINDFSKSKLDNFDECESIIERILNYLIDYYETYSLLRTFTFLSLSTDARNEKATKLLEKLNKKNTNIKKSMVRMQKWLASLDNLEEIINKNTFIQQHKFFLEELIKENKYILSEEEELLISQMKNTGSRAWTKLQQDLTSTLMVKVNLENEDKELPLPVVRNMAHDKDASIRKKAYHAELIAYKKIEEPIAASLNGIKGEVITTTELRGYNSPLEKTLIDSRMDHETMQIMITAIEESLPLFHKYYRHKARLLGHNKGLPFYDLFAPIANANFNFTYTDARNFIVDKFRSFSPQLANYAANTFEKRWIDAKPRKGKMGGAFCSNIHSISESRILTNFTGSYSDVSTLAHELGHGYHGFCLKDESILNSDYPMPLAETASIFCQTIVDSAAIEEADSDSALAILDNSLSDAGQVIVDIYSRYLFESKLFEMREESSLSVKELKEIMLWAQKESYGSGIDADYLHPYMWLCKPHYYEASLNFYNFPYAFGLLFAKGLYARYQIEGEGFVKEYDDILRATGRMKITDVCKLAGIDISSKEFWKESLDIIAEDINNFIKISSA